MIDIDEATDEGGDRWQGMEMDRCVVSVWYQNCDVYYPPPRSKLNATSLCKTMHEPYS